MGDVDWSKRAWPGYEGANAFSSMGDVDWSKRSSVGGARQFGPFSFGDDGNNRDKRTRGLYRNWLAGGTSPGIRQSTYE